jgi:hypothetical protein
MNAINAARASPEESAAAKASVSSSIRAFNAAGSPRKSRRVANSADRG